MRYHFNAYCLFIAQKSIKFELISLLLREALKCINSLTENQQIMLLAILFPFLSFIFRGKIITGIICLILQITILGWIPAAIWAALSLQNARAEKRNRQLIEAIKNHEK